MHLFVIAIITGLAMGVWAVAMSVWGICENIAQFARKHPLEFTRAFLGGAAGLSVALLLGIPYEFTLTGVCAVCSVVAGEII